MSLSIRSLKPYVPARDFETSKSFYRALGFEYSAGWGGTADFELNGCQFRLQNYYVAEWANNFMFVLRVDDVEAWHRHVCSMETSGEFNAMRIKPPERIGEDVVLHVTDPAGVLLVFVQSGG